SVALINTSLAHLTVFTLLAMQSERLPVSWTAAAVKILPIWKKVDNKVLAQCTPSTVESSKDGSRWSGASGSEAASAGDGSPPVAGRLRPVAGRLRSAASCKDPNPMQGREDKDKDDHNHRRGVLNLTPAFNAIANQARQQKQP